MPSHFIVRSLSGAVILIFGTTLSGCFYAMNSDAPGVPLAQLEISGAAPVELSLAGPDRVVLVSGEALAIEVEGDGEDLRFDLGEQSLGIGRNGKWSESLEPATIRITMPPAEMLTLSGSGRIDAASLADDSRLELAGSGSIAVGRIEAEKLNVEIAGSGSVSGAGTVRDLEIEIAGSGDVGFEQIEAVNASIEIAGSGDVAFASNGTVNASIAGSGDIVVVGSAQCSLSSAGSGTLTCEPASGRRAAGLTGGTARSD